MQIISNFCQFPQLVRAQQHLHRHQGKVEMPRPVVVIPEALGFKLGLTTTQVETNSSMNSTWASDLEALQGRFSLINSCGPI